MTSSNRWSRLHTKAHLGVERGSMAILMMVVLVGLMLSALLVPMIITQTRTTRFDSTRVQALNAAQAGIDVMLGVIRASVSADGIGVTSKLPCTDPLHPLTGIVNSNSVASYSLMVEYFTLDPVRDTTYPSALAMTCVPGYGTFNAGSGATTPGFARFTSTGTVGAATNGSTAGRTLTSTYAFRTNDTNIPGGLLQINPASAGLCMGVGSTASAGTPVVLQACSTTKPLAPQQVFSYRMDLTLQLVSSATTAAPNGLCLDYASTLAGAGDALRLGPCVKLGQSPTYTQQWSYNDNGQYQAALPTSATTGKGVLASLCINVSSQAVNQAVTVGGCGSGWVPSPSVGPGAAALPQWINWNEFGRCMDVTNQDPGHAFLIDYPCKQNPFPGAKTWNQLFQAPVILPGQASVLGQISTCNSVPATSNATVCNATKYCLTSPAINLGKVKVTACAGDPLLPNTWQATQTWTIYGGDSSLNYSTKYTIVSGSLCLGLSAPDSSLKDWSTIDVETCSGTTAQKWNAVASVLISALKNFHER